MNVDWDLLADHFGGALAGAEAARVERLVATDPNWASAAGELSAALAAVATDLRTLPAPALPDDIAARLDAALAAAPAPDVKPATSPSPGRSVDESRRPPSRPGTPRRRRRITRWSAGLAVAAGVATFAAIGLGSWLGNWEQAPTPGVSDADGEANGDVAAPESRVEQDTPATALDEAYHPQIVATGNDYQEETLADTPPPRNVSIGGQDEPSPTFAPAPEEPPGSVLPPLFRLWTDPVARAACLALITSSLQPPPVSITAIDFATFEGQPALVIWATTGDGTRWAWVSGPDCGKVAGDPDVQFETQLS